MANYQRFQTISAGPQNRFDPDSPVWVSRYRLSRDLESGKRLLQVRMVNRSDKTVSRVFLRVRCIEASTRKTTELQMVPVAAVLALPGKAFGDDRIVELPVGDAAFIEAYVQRAVFSDGTGWNEPSAPNYIAFAAPVPVSVDDADYQQLKETAAEGGVRNSYRFHTQKGVWTCTCGQPNSTAALRCDHCGADRLWLEKHMDPDYRAPKPEPAPEPAPEPVRAPAAAPAPLIVPIMPAPQAPPPGGYSYPAAPQPKPAARPEPEEEPEPSHAGRNLAIVLILLVFLAVGAWAGWEYLRPYLRYRDAVSEQISGNYERAQAIFQELGDYKDSAERIAQTQVQKIQAVMRGGDYRTALQMLEADRSLAGGDALRADCIYSLGVLAFNGGDVDGAWAYVEQLKQDYPDYDGLPQLTQYCCYSFGNRKANEAGGLEDSAARIAAYQEAIAFFDQTGGYADSGERMTECSYRIAIELMNAEELEHAIEAFEALGEYKKSTEYRFSCMFRYVQLHLEAPDETAQRYLDALVAADYPGAQDLYDRLNGQGFSFLLISDPATAAAVTQSSDLGKIYVRYTVEPKDESGAVLVLARYTLPDGRQGRGLLNSDRSASGTKAWSELFPTECTVSGQVTVAFFDSERGETEPIDTQSFQYVYEESQPEPPAETDPENTDPQVPTESGRPTAGRPTAG